MKYGTTFIPDPPAGTGRSFSQDFMRYLSETLLRHPSLPSTGFVPVEDEISAWTREAEQRDAALAQSLNASLILLISGEDVRDFLCIVLLVPAVIYAVGFGFFWALRGFKTNPHST